MNVIDSDCFTKYIQAEVKIVPAANQRLLRSDQQAASKQDEAEPSAIQAFYKLLGESKRRRMTGSGSDSHNRLSFDVDALKLIPGDTDVRRFSLNAQPSIEEEMILAVSEGQDKHIVQQRDNRRWKLQGNKSASCFPR